MFVRSWTLKPDGWSRTSSTTRSARFKWVSGRCACGGQGPEPRILAAMEVAYAAKYPTPASRTYVRGFRTARRRAASMEFVRR